MQPGDPVLKALFDACRRRAPAGTPAARTRGQGGRRAGRRRTRTRTSARRSLAWSPARAPSPCPLARAKRASSIAAVTVHGACTRRREATGNSCKRRWRGAPRSARCLARWNCAVGEFGLEAADRRPRRRRSRRSRSVQAHIEDVRRLTFDFDAKLHSRLEEVLRQAHRRPHVGRWRARSSPLAYSSLQAHVDKGRLGLRDEAGAGAGAQARGP